MQIITGLDTVAMSQDVTYKIIIKVIKKAQLSLTHPRDAKACQKLLQFDVFIQRCRWQYCLSSFV